MKGDSSSLQLLGMFAATEPVPDAARVVARGAVEDTIGVAVAGASEDVCRMVQSLAREESPGGPSRVLGTALRTSSSWAALANGTAAHALDFDDMCWVTMAHPSAPLVGAGLAVAEAKNASGRTLLEGYAVGFEVGVVLGRVLNPDHYENGWHCTSTIGTIGAAATAARVIGLDPDTTTRALAIAASEASGLKANFGTMVKPLQVGLAARNGVLAVQLARLGMTASNQAIDGDQGMLVAMRGSGTDLSESLEELGRRWEIVDGGITVKLYPSCAATHPTIDTLLDLRREHAIDPLSVSSIEVSVDPVVPTVLAYDRPRTGLEGKFSLPYCAAAALAHGDVGIETFTAASLDDPIVQRLVERVTTRVDDTLGVDAPPLTQARITLRLADGRTFTRVVEGARGYPARAPTRADRADKFLGCATRALSPSAAEGALSMLQRLDGTGTVSEITNLLVRTDTPVAAAGQLT